MSGKGTYFRVGIFVLTSMALIILGVVAFGVGLSAGRSTITAEHGKRTEPPMASDDG